MENRQNYKQNVTPGQQPAAGEWDINMIAARKEHEKRERLNRAITDAEQNGKEAFDYEKFVNSYWRKNAFSGQLQGDETEAMIKRYKEEYYLEFPEAKTVEEFAEALEKRDESLEE